MSEVTLQFLGSGDAFGSGGRLQTCIYVDEAGQGFLLDCGTTALIGLKRWDISPEAIDAILVTHLHGDHFGGIPFFLLEAQLVGKRTRPLVIAGPPGLKRRIHEAQEILFPGSSQLEFRFVIDYIELKVGRPAKIGPYLLGTAYLVNHPSGSPAFALRVEARGKVISYSGDTEWTESLVQAADSADLFICEAYTFDKKISFHLAYQTLLEHRQELGCRRMILTHMSEEMLARIGGLGVEAAEDGLQIQI